MVVWIYQYKSERLSFVKDGRVVTGVEVPEGSSIEPVRGLMNLSGGQVHLVLMVPSVEDPAVRQAFDARDVILNSRNTGTRFRLTNKC